MQTTKLNLLYKLVLMTVLGLTSSAWAQQTETTFGTLPVGSQYCFPAVQPTSWIEIYGESHHVNGTNPSDGTIWSIWVGPTQAETENHYFRIFHQRSAGVGDIEALSGPTIFVGNNGLTGNPPEIPPGWWAEDCVDADTTGAISFEIVQTWQ